ncbi:tetratricopeptide repeat protein [Microcystis sp. LEGE 08355]|uniref:tetratricopeptide repeat protein n=1 Tax=Microcystis sp. LEGE 08355 TaxID=1828687 RepID=UPI00187DE47F|nr:tetratricopeptide repeat protein [Microcystis sp. LEGE 08355]MBE9073963.1 tetratricopeptide repeat protein [Microcystis sp. LEGE 08355]
MKPQLLKLCLILSLFPLIFSLVSCQNQQTQDRGITITTNQSQSQQKQRRTALVIGNASYQDNPLKNSINDAEAMANALKDVGFDVILLENADLKQIENAIDTFHHQLKAGGVGLFYYAGHGTQVDGENYLIPVNAKLDVAEDVRYEAIPVGKVLARMEDAANQMNIVILDACRNNPFARKWRSSQRGLAPIQSARGALIAFATEPGGVAADGEGENGLYTSFLLKHLKTPNLDVELMFKRVREDVVQATQNKQVPWESSSLVGDFSFNPVTVAQSSQPNSTTAETYFKQGEDYRNNNQYDKAIAAYTKAIEINPQYAEAYKNRGIVYSDLKDYDKAMADNNKAIEINPQYSNAYNNRGVVYRILKDYDKAMADYNKAIEINPQLFQAYFNRGNVYSDLKEYDKAIKDYNKVIEINPQYADAYVNRGTVYSDLKEYDKAIKDYNKAIEINPQLFQAYNNRGVVYRILKDYDKAIKDYNKAIEINPQYADAYVNRGTVYSDLKEYDKAMADYNKAIEINPQNDYAYNGRGNVYLELKEYDKAIKDYNKAIEINPQNPYASNNKKLAEEAKRNQ